MGRQFCFLPFHAHILHLFVLYCFYYPFVLCEREKTEQDDRVHVINSWVTCEKYSYESRRFLCVCGARSILMQTILSRESVISTHSNRIDFPSSIVYVAIIVRMLRIETTTMTNSIFHDFHSAENKTWTKHWLFDALCIVLRHTYDTFLDFTHFSPTSLTKCPNRCRTREPEKSETLTYEAMNFHFIWFYGMPMEFLLCYCVLFSGNSWKKCIFYLKFPFIVLK